VTGSGHHADIDEFTEKPCRRALRYARALSDLGETERALSAGQNLNDLHSLNKWAAQPVCRGQAARNIGVRHCPSFRALPASQILPDPHRRVTSVTVRSVHCRLVLVARMSAVDGQNGQRRPRRHLRHCDTVGTANPPDPIGFRRPPVVAPRDCGTCMPGGVGPPGLARVEAA
jgi:hypothetical protein